MNRAFIEVNKTDWLATDFGYPTLKSAIEDFTVSEALKNRPLLVDLWKAFDDSGMAKLKSILKNPSITSTTPPQNVGTRGREWKTRGMNSTKNWYYSLRVDGPEGDSETSYGDGGASTIDSYP